MFISGDAVKIIKYELNDLELMSENDSVIFRVIKKDGFSEKEYLKSLLDGITRACEIIKKDNGIE